MWMGGDKPPGTGGDIGGVINNNNVAMMGNVPNVDGGAIGGSSDNNIGTLGGAPPPLPAASANNHSNSDSRKSLPLTAVTLRGTVAITRLLVGNRNVSPPGSVVGGGADDHDVGRMEDLEGLEKSTSNDHQFTISNNTDTGADDSTNSSVAGEDAEVAAAAAAAPRRGRSASHDGLADMLDQGREPILPRDTSNSSSDVAATSGTGGGTATASGASNTDQQHQQQQQQSRSAFEASLLLGIAAETTSNASSATGSVGLDKEKREPVDPATLPSSMTSFLDMLSEDQRRVRHRHIPGVEGFRKLYKSEVKSDMSEARKLKRAKNIVLENPSTLDENGDEGEGEGGDVKMMDVEGEENEEPQAEKDEDVSDVDKEEREDRLWKPHREAFVVPDKDMIKCAASGQLAGIVDGTDAENVIRTNNGTSNATTTATAAAAAGLNPQRSPLLVDSLTSFDPPRPQESTAAKTAHRLQRWENHPDEVEKDLANYRKTVARTREELHKARKAREVTERVTSLVRVHFADHLRAYREETGILNEQGIKTNAEILKTFEEEHSKKEEDNAGGKKKAKASMKDVLMMLKTLGEEVDKGTGATVAGAAESVKDWRAVGVGGVSSVNGGGGKDGEDKDSMASGWLLPGDEVIVAKTGEEGTVVAVTGPKSSKKKAAPQKKKSKDKDAMDVDTPNKGDKKAAETTTKTEVTGAKVRVKLSKSGQVKTLDPSAVKFNPAKLPDVLLSNQDLSARWESMVKTALANGVDHDAVAMEEYIESSLVAAAAREKDALDEDDDDNESVAEKKEGSSDEKKKDSETSGGSPDSGPQTSVEAMLPFGAGFLAAPKDVRNFPSVIPLDELEATIRKTVYEADRPRVIATMSPAIRPIEARSEEINALKGKVLQMRNRLGRQKRLRSLNENSLASSKSRGHRVEGLLLEMQMDLKNLKERLQDELNELGIGISSPDSTPTEANGEKENNEMQVETAATEQEEPINKLEENKPNSDGSSSSPADTPTADKRESSMEVGEVSSGAAVPADAKQEDANNTVNDAGSATIETKPVSETKGGATAAAAAPSDETKPAEPTKKADDESAVTNKSEMEPESKRPRVEGV